MKFLPYERLKIRTALSRPEVLKRLAEVVEPKRYFRFLGTSSKPYEGKVEGSRFEIARIIGYRNSFLPMITGEVKPEAPGCAIHLTLHPHFLVMAFMVVWLGGVGVAFVGALSTIISALAQAQPTEPALVLFPTGMFVFGCVLFVGAFKVESVKSKKFFSELFEAQEVEEQ